MLLQNRMGVSVGLVLLSALLSLIFASRPVSAADDFDSLRAVVMAANSSGRATVALTGDIMLTAALPAITGRVTIEGGGHSISGDDAYRIFDVDGGALTVRDVTLVGGNAGEGRGGAIRLRNGAEVTLDRATVSANQALHGGAIATSGGGDRLTISDSSIAGNIAEQSAGAIYARGGAVSISNSEFEKNCALFATFRLVRSGSDGGTPGAGADGCFRVRYVRKQIEADLQTDVDGGAIRLLHGARVEIEDSTLQRKQGVVWRRAFDREQECAAKRQREQLCRQSRQ